LIRKVSFAGNLFDQKEPFLKVIKNIDSIFNTRNSESERLDISSKIILEIREVLQNSNFFDDLFKLDRKAWKRHEFPAIKYKLRYSRK
jgi:hypothetical protein